MIGTPPAEFWMEIESAYQIDAARRLCGFRYTHASGFVEVCTRDRDQCDIIGHGDWRSAYGQV